MIVIHILRASLIVVSVDMFRDVISTLVYVST